jgi:hypothetical protein
MAVRPRGAGGDARQVPIVIGTNDRDLVASNSPTAPIQRLCFANDRHRKQADLLVNRVTIRSEPVYNFRTIQPHRLIRDTQRHLPKTSGHLMTPPNPQSNGAQNTLTKIMLGDVVGVSDFEALRPLSSQ